MEKKEAEKEELSQTLWAPSGYSWKVIARICDYWEAGTCSYWVAKMSSHSTSIQKLFKPGVQQSIRLKLS